MPTLPVEQAPNSMSRRNYLVERNRLRVKAYEPTRRAYEEEELRLAKQREEQRKKVLDNWRSSVSLLADNSRPLPGAARRARQAKDQAGATMLTESQTMKEEELQRKAARVASNRADMLQQLKDRREFLRQWKANEKAYEDSLMASNREFARQMQERERETAQMTKEYMDRVRASNLKELEQKRIKQKEREDAELAALRIVNENQERAMAAEERSAKDMKRMMQIENEENHRYAKKKQQEDKSREEAEIKAMMEYNEALAKRERRAQEQKRDQFKADFEETVAKQKEFRRLHNYEEPPESIRKRNEETAASIALIKQEERIRSAERKREYCGELMKQMREKQEWMLTHLDGI
ncbi:hypothetical protein ERJ75_001350600 [Trypanosoma vivax]|uniref:Trichohyalin-plectin-homology domain-containing protein n=1 Tax=Trypanosoma vivax (strain Y486) TaxID=1055687 RepID=G0UD05_TRYVY|nr:hypothetical protein TRVL_04872 [Trypanosoma vivax]KAH8607847.1 hypothetical protein ERJ75_001350600 [Trypanosoma vivax]CCC53715.1 conserved hypothetical protein [Trypanosoma vivax Y486]